LLVERQSGVVSYFDFGRYIAPRGYGRARSQVFDPRLAIQTCARFEEFGSEIINLSELLEELAKKEDFTHGGGKLLFSLAKGISYQRAFDYASKLVEEGPILYGALAAGNNSCSRYVAQILVCGMPSKDPRIRKIYYPECLKASPTSNVVNASSDGGIYCHHDGQVEMWKMDRLSSLRYQWGLLQDNLSRKKSTSLAKDDSLPLLQEPNLPFYLPTDVSWLGGIGEGMWFQLEVYENDSDSYWVTAYCTEGRPIYQTEVRCEATEFDIRQRFRFSTKLSGSYFTIEQGGRDFVFRKVDEQENNYKQKVY
jgi:hypothetical protein